LFLVEHEKVEGLLNGHARLADEEGGALLRVLEGTELLGLEEVEGEV